MLASAFLWESIYSGQGGVLNAVAQDNWVYFPKSATTNLYTPTDDSQQKPKIVQNILSAPLLFERNEGQVDAHVKYLARSAGGVTYFFTEDGSTILLSKSSEHGAESGESQRDKFLAESHNRIGINSEKREIKSHALKITYVGANPNPRITAEVETQTISNYFIGNDPTKWRSEVSNHKKIRYHNVYDGIDIVYYGNGRQLEYDFVVHPGANPDVIRIQYEGAVEPLRIDEEGNVVIATSVGLLHEKKPDTYQSQPPIQTTNVVQAGGSNPKSPIESHWSVVSPNKLAFSLGEYDRTQILYIDPLIYSTFLGGSNSENGRSIAIDGSGNVYVTGSTQSADFPTTVGAYDQTHNESLDIFVAKLNSSGTTLLYSTFLGGSGSDESPFIAIDGSGNAFVTGKTPSSDFPTTTGAYDPSHNGGSDVFLTKLNSTGSELLYSTFLGGNGFEAGSAIVIDGSGNAYVIGETQSTNYPTTSGAFDQSPNGDYDTFIKPLKHQTPVW